MSEFKKVGLPGPWVDPTVNEIGPWRSTTGIVKFIEFVVPIPEMDQRAFHLYWQKHHSPNVMNVTPFSQFMRKYNTGHAYPRPVEAVSERYVQDGLFVGAAEVWLNSESEVGDWLGHPLYAELVQPDEPRFIAQDGRTRLLVTKEERVYVPDLDLNENDRTKVYLLYKRAERFDAESFHSGLSKVCNCIASDTAARKSLLKMTISHKLADPNSIQGLPEADIDAVVELWFEDRLQLRRFFQEPVLSDLSQWENLTLDGMPARAVVAKMKVVHDEFSFQPSVTQPLLFDWSEMESDAQ
jgi:hypothetical protein